MLVVVDVVFRALMYTALSLEPHRRCLDVPMTRGTSVWMFHTPSRKYPHQRCARACPHSDVEVKMYLLRMYSTEVSRLLDGSSDVSDVDADWLMSSMSKMMSVDVHVVVAVVLDGDGGTLAVHDVGGQRCARGARCPPNRP